jgi:hypothetical protein
MLAHMTCYRLLVASSVPKTGFISALDRYEPDTCSATLLVHIYGTRIDLEVWRESAPARHGFAANDIAPNFRSG